MTNVVVDPASANSMSENVMGSMGVNAVGVAKENGWKKILQVDESNAMQF